MLGALSMFLGLLRLEWRLVRADRSWWAAMALTGLLTAGGVASGLSFARARAAAVAGFAEREAEQVRIMRSAFPESGDAGPGPSGRPAGGPLTRPEVLRAIAKIPTSLAYYGGAWSALSPPSPAAALSIGQAVLWPARYPATAWSRRSNLEREEIVNPLHAAAGPFDPAAVAAALLPLVLIALTHDLVSSDRERGVLALMRSQPTPYGAIALAKLLVRAGPPALIVAALPCAGVAIAEGGRIGPGTAGALAAWSLLVLLSAACWAGLALLVNALGGSSSSNAIALAAAWVALVVLIPSGIVRVAPLLRPVPPRSGLITLERGLRERAEADGSLLVDRYYREHPAVPRPAPEEDPYGQVRWDAIAREVDRRFQPEIDRRREAVAARLAFAERWQALSPALALKSSLDDLAGTGLAHQLEFQGLAAGHHERFMAFLHPRMMARSPLTLAEFDAIPRCDSPSPAPHPRRIAAGLLALVGWTLATFSIGLALLRRPMAVV